MTKSMYIFEKYTYQKLFYDKFASFGELSIDQDQFDNFQ